MQHQTISSMHSLPFSLSHHLAMLDVNDWWSAASLNSPTSHAGYSVSPAFCMPSLASLRALMPSFTSRPCHQALTLHDVHTVSQKWYVLFVVLVSSLTHPRISPLHPSPANAGPVASSACCTCIHSSCQARLPSLPQCKLWLRPSVAILPFLIQYWNDPFACIALTNNSVTIEI